MKTLADAVKELPYNEFVVLLLDAERDLEHRIIQRLVKLWTNGDDELAYEISKLETALNLAIKTRLQLEAAYKIGKQAYCTIAELMQEPLRKIDRALRGYPLVEA